MNNSTKPGSKPSLDFGKNAFTSKKIKTIKIKQEFLQNRSGTQVSNTRMLGHIQIPTKVQTQSAVSVRFKRETV